MPATRRAQLAAESTAPRARLRTAPTIRAVDPLPESTNHPIGQFIARSFFFLLTCSLAFLGYWLLAAPALAVSTVEVRGTYYLANSDVSRAANVVGTPIFLVSSTSIRSRVVALGVPRDVSLTYRPPNVVIIAVKERTAAYNWKVAGSNFAVADDGVVLGPTLDPAQIVVTALNESLAKPGDRVDPRVLREAAYLSTSIPKVAGFTPSSFVYARDQGVSFTATRGVQIVIGDDQFLDVKVAAVPPSLKAALSQATVPKTIDLRVPARPLMR